MDLSAYGFTLGYWSNFQLNEGDGIAGNEVNETDIMIDYSFDVTETFSVSVGNLHYTYSAYNSDLVSDDEMYVGCALDVLLAPEFYAYYAWDVDDNDGMDGLFYTLAISHGFEPSETVALGLGASVGYNQENPLVGDYAKLHNYELTVSVDYVLTDNLSLTGGMLYSDALSDDAEDEGVEDETVGSLDITFAF
jgi:hypothetical protein